MILIIIKRFLKSLVNYLFVDIYGGQGQYIATQGDYFTNIPRFTYFP